ncbi:MAG: penicillin acylase family protein [Acidobacteria bacterium]|nr:penicillin acylase family protein [Acidobacteriota bacterium]
MTPVSKRTILFRWLKRLAIGVLLFVVLSGLTGGICYYRWFQSPLPQLDGEVRLPGLSAPVTISRDEYGVPHIQGANTDDLALAQGYAVAQDRLWQMDLLRRAARGELAEIFGEERLAYDQAQRRLGYVLVAQQGLEKLPPDMRRNLDAFTQGVNAYIEQHRDRLPAEFHLLRYTPRPWETLDSLVIGKLMAQSLNTSFPSDLMRETFRARFDAQTCNRLFGDTNPLDRILVGSDATAPLSPNGNPVPAPEKKEDPKLAQIQTKPELSDPILEREALALVGLDGDGLGSNNWVIGGTRTVTGKPILCNDTHLGHSVPSIWYMVHLMTTDGGFNVSGFVFPGIPGVVIGHNSRIAWGVTNFGPDVQDLFVETFNPVNPGEYRVGDAWEKASFRTERIRVRKSLWSTETREEVLQVTTTRHGPIVREENGKRYALRWTALDPLTEFPTFDLLSKAATWQDFQAALKLYPGPMQNFIYADVDGNIGYWAAGMVPIRKSGDGSVPVDGASGEGEWTGYIPFEQLPHLFNPAEGYIVTANQRITGKSIPEFYTHQWYAPYRAAAIQRRILMKEKHTLDSMNTIHADSWSYPDDLFVKEVLKLFPNHKSEETWQRIHQDLSEWNGELQADSRVAAIVTTWRLRFIKKLLEARLGTFEAKYRWENAETVYASLILDRPADWLPKKFKSYDDLLAATYREAIVELEQKFGKYRTTWNYGALNTLEFSHPLARISLLKPILNPPVLVMNGSANTVNAYGRGKVWGVSMRQVVDLSNLDNSLQAKGLAKGFRPAGSLCNSRGAKPTVWNRQNDKVTG